MVEIRELIAELDDFCLSLSMSCTCDDKRFVNLESDQQTCLRSMYKVQKSIIRQKHKDVIISNLKLIDQSLGMILSKYDELVDLNFYNQGAPETHSKEYTMFRQLSEPDKDILSEIKAEFYIDNGKRVIGQNIAQLMSLFQKIKSSL